MKAFKDTKRRIVQKAAEKFGNAEHVSKDEEVMANYVESFKAFEAEVKELQDTLKTIQSTTQKWTEKNLLLAERLSNFFSTEEGSLKQSSFQMSTSALRAHEVVQRSAARVIEDRAVAVLDGLLNERFPQIKKKITTHNNSEMDVSAYTNRLKHLMEKKSANASDPDIVRAKEKLDGATASYDRLHDELLNELLTLNNEKHNILKPVLAAVLGGYSELHSALFDGYSAALSAFEGQELQEVKREMSSWVQSGGPPSETPARSISMKNLFKAGASGTLKLNRGGGGDAEVTPPKPERPMGSSNSGKTSPMGSKSMKNLYPDAPPPPLPEKISNNGPTPSKTFEEPLAAEIARNNHQNDASQGDADLTKFAPGAVCEALYDYEGPDPGDLSFKKNEKVTMSVEVSPGWWNGTREEDGSYGLFPETYVRRVA